MQDRPNLLLIMVDQLRRDHVGWSGASPVATPNLDRLAEGVVFDQAYSTNPICMPARAALLTGKYTRQIGCLAMSGDLSLEHSTFPRALQQKGYHTALIGKLHVNQSWPWRTPRHGGLDLLALEPEIKRYGFDTLFEVSGKQLASHNRCHFTARLEAEGVLDEYLDYVQAEGPNTRELETTRFTGQPWPLAEELHPDIIIAERALEFLGEYRKDEPFFLQVSFCSPHPPFDPPERFLQDDALTWQPKGPHDTTQVTARDNLQAMARAYRGLVRLVDEQVGRLINQLEAQGLMESTVIAFVTDHGEMLGDTGAMQKASWRDPSVHIPMAIRHPDYLKSQRITTPVEHTDLAATFLDLAGLDPAQALGPAWPAYQDLVPAKSLLPLIQGSASKLREAAYSECLDWQMLTDGRYKYVRHRQAKTPGQPIEYLFDGESDPKEAIDLVSNPELAAVLERFRSLWAAKVDELIPAQTSWAPYRSPPHSD